ncbi:MAG: DUF4105 domain-containing protein [Deltaproteobacteria bacterium]|nr:DUF4105 domain-containing protein [Deltaproteobacteria bacterium]
MQVPRLIAAALLLSVFGSEAAVAASDPAYADELVLKARQEALHLTRQWRKLLHYKKDTSNTSEADGEEFFLARDGKTNPQGELAATIRGFFSKAPVPEGKQHPQCRFPARFLWLSKRLAFDPTRLERKRCPRFENFRAKMAAKSVTLVFSSYYLNNPASAFGHTFLRLNKSNSPIQSERHELLDYGINYAANVTVKNALLYAIYGVAGVFQGTFTSLPFYYKVREYSDYESRDLWEYELDFTPEQLELLVAHLWELGSTYFDYFYFTENCSYHILGALEAAAPEYRFTERNPYVVIPSDTVRVVANTPGLVRRVGFRPSARTVFWHRLRALSNNERAALDTVLSERSDGKTLPAAIGDRGHARVLDTAIDFIDYRYGKKLLLADSEPRDTRLQEPEPHPEAAWKRKLLSERAHVPVIAEPLAIEPPLNEMPHVGHAARRFTLMPGHSDRHGPFLGLGMRFALHDLLDPVAGYPEYAQIEFFGGRLRYNFDQRTVWLEDAALFRVTSLTPLNRYHPQLSWRVRLGAETIRDRTCEECLAGLFELGGGATWRPSETVPFSVVGMLEAEVAAAPRFGGSAFRLGAGPALRLKNNFSDKLIASAWSAYRAFALTRVRQGYEYGAEIRNGFSRDVAAGLKATRYPRTWEYAAAFFYYF